MTDLKIVLLMLVLISITGCSMGYPDTIKPVKGFDINKYLGKWYEIARLDHSFERGLENVSAEYSLRSDGGINVLNSGYSVKDKKWKTAKGKAFFVNEADEAFLKVSFFLFFYGSYVIFELDSNYEYAFVSGPNNSYLWLLSRTSEVSPEIIERFKAKAKEGGFNIDELIFVNHVER